MTLFYSNLLFNLTYLFSGCSPEDLKRFDNHVLLVIKGKENGGKPPAKVVGDRTLKHMFRKLIGQLIGKDVAKMFKQNVVIKNLPTLIVSYYFLSFLLAFKFSFVLHFLVDKA